MLSEDMKRLTDDIVTLYDTRVSFVNNLINGTSDMLETFRKERSDMSKHLLTKLQSDFYSLKSTMDEFLAERKKTRMDNAKDLKESLKQFTDRLTTDVENLIRSYSEFRTQMAKDQDAFLKDFTNQLSSDTATLLKNFSNTHSEMAKALREMLESENQTRKVYNESRKADAAVFMEELAKAHEEMAKELNGFLASSETTRKNQFEEMMEIISGRLSELRTRTRQVLETSDELMKAFKKDHEGMAEAWNEMTIAMKNRRMMGKRKAKVIEENERKKKQMESLKASVLEVVSQAKDGGIKLTQMGKELGRPWQSLIPSITELVDEGEVIRDEEGFYR